LGKVYICRAKSTATIIESLWFGTMIDLDRTRNTKFISVQSIASTLVPVGQKKSYEVVLQLEPET